MDEKDKAITDAQATQQKTTVIGRRGGNTSLSHRAKIARLKFTVSGQIQKSRSSQA